MDKEQELREKMLAVVDEYYTYAFGKTRIFVSGNRIGYGGRVFGE